MTRIRLNTISEDSTRTGTAMSSRRRTYLYMGRVRATAYLSSQLRTRVGEPYPSVRRGAVGRPAELGRQLVDDRIVDPEEVLGRLRVHVLIGPLVHADGVARLEPPRHAVPLPLDVTAVVGRVVQLGDLDVDVEILLEVLLDQLDLGGHLREVLVIE